MSKYFPSSKHCISLVLKNYWLLQSSDSLSAKINCILWIRFNATNWQKIAKWHCFCIYYHLYYLLAFHSPACTTCCIENVFRSLHFNYLVLQCYSAKILETCQFNFYRSPVTVPPPCQWNIPLCSYFDSVRCLLMPYQSNSLGGNRLSYACHCSTV